MQGIAALGAFAFQNLATAILLTTKSYILRTVILGIFFFGLLPLGKILLIKAGLLTLSPAILSRAAHAHAAEDPYDTPTLHTVHGTIETVLWEIYHWIENFYSPDELDDYLYL